MYIASYIATINSPHAIVAIFSNIQCYIVQAKVVHENTVKNESIMIESDNYT